jgi:hypothetical protein
MPTKKSPSKTAVKSDMVDSIMAKVREIQRGEPETLPAINQLLNLPLERIRQRRSARGATNRRLLARLQAKHDCDREGGGAFEAVEPQFGIRRWLCLGCGSITTLED